MDEDGILQAAEQVIEAFCAPGLALMAGDQRQLMSVEQRQLVLQAGIYLQLRRIERLLRAKRGN